METKAAGSLTHGRLGKQILAFSLPLMLSNVLQVLFNMSDIAVVGRFSGPIALGAVGSTATLVTLFTGFLIGLGSGINALVARFLGAGSREETQRTVHTALALSLIFGAVLLLLGELTAVPLLKLLGTKEELIDGATIYLRIYFLGMPAMALYNFGNAVLSAAGDTRRPLLYLLIAGILNVALNLFFVIVCGMSADGVALASILTQYLSSVLILIALVRTQDAYGVRPKCIRLHRDKLAPLLTLCCSAGLQNAIFAVANLFIQAGVNRLRRPDGRRQLRRRQRRRPHLRRHGCLPHSLCQLHRAELRRGQPRPRAQDLLDQPQLLVRGGRRAWPEPCVLRPRLPCPLHGLG